MSEMELELYCSVKERLRAKAQQADHPKDSRAVYWLDDFSNHIGIDISGHPLFTKPLFIPGIDFNGWGFGEGKGTRWYVTERGLDKLIALAAGLKILQLREGATVL